MTDEDDPLAGIALDAWQPPPAPGGTADAVLRRMREPVAVAAHELGGRPRRRWPLWASAGVAIAAAASVLVIGPWGAPAPAPGGDGRGDVIAERASHLDLGPTSAELDAGTALSWRRDHRRVAVAQLRGAATWRVVGDDVLELDAGAMGASVEASGASLRVEVQMQIAHSDARVVAASAVTAAAVALVTIVVYQGHVKVASGGQTVNVAAGGRVEVKPGASPREVREVATAAPGEEGAGGQAASASAEEGRTIAPVELEAHRLKGNKQVMPDSYEQRAMQSAHEDRVIAAIKLCVDTTGAVSQVRILRSSGYPGYDQKIASEVSAWGFRPIEIDGKAVPVCTALSFIYSQK